jgi:hypothetical protein
MIVAALTLVYGSGVIPSTGVAWERARGSVRGAQDDDVVFVVGSVAKPGPYPYEAKMTAGDAIDRAGGPKHPKLSSCIFLLRQVDGQPRRTGATRDTAVLRNDTIDLMEVNDGGRARPCP